MLQAGFSKVCFIPVVWKCQAKITEQSFILTGEKKRSVLHCSSHSGVVGERQKAQHLKKVLPELQAEG